MIAVQVRELSYIKCYIIQTSCLKWCFDLVKANGFLRLIARMNGFSASFSQGEIIILDILMS